MPALFQAESQVEAGPHGREADNCQESVTRRKGKRLKHASNPVCYIFTLSMKVFSARVILCWPDFGAGAVIS